MDDTKLTRLLSMLNRHGRRKLMAKSKRRVTTTHRAPNINFQRHKPSCQCKGTGVFLEALCTQKELARA